MADSRVLVVVPARGGSKGLPGKNTHDFCGLPLLAHTILCARMVLEVSRVVVSTDSEEIQSVALAYGADAPFLRPERLATDESPVWDTIRHALETVEEREGKGYDYLALLEPTSPLREPQWISEALARLAAHETADGIHGVSLLIPNPIWNSLIFRKAGYLDYLVPEGRFYHRRQDVPPAYRMDGSLHIWRTRFVRQTEGGYQWGKYLGYVTDSARACSIDVLEDLVGAQRLVQEGVIKLAWLQGGACGVSS